MAFDLSIPSHSQAFTMHWDRVAWRLVPSSVTGPLDADGLAAITAISPNDIWTIGNSVKQNQQTLVEHWNGNAWRFARGSKGIGAVALRPRLTAPHALERLTARPQCLGGRVGPGANFPGRRRVASELLAEPK